MPISKEVLIQLLDELRVGVLVWRLDDTNDDASLTLAYANAAASAALGHDIRAMTGKRMRDAFPSTTPERWRLYADVVRSGKARTLGEVAYSDAQTPEAMFAVSAVPLTDHCVAAVFENVSLQRKSEHALRNANAFLDSIIENMPAMVFVKDARELRFERFNRAGEELLGLKRDQLIGKNDHDFFPKEQAAFFQDKDRQVLAGGKLLDIPEEPIQTPRGERWLHTRKIPIVGSDDQPGHLLGISLDITENREAREALREAHAQLEQRVEERTAALHKTEDQLRQSMKMEAIGRLAGGVAHDFNNLLSIVLSYSEFLLEKLDPGDPRRADAEQIKRAGERATDLTRQLLAFGRKQMLQPVVVDLGTVIRGLERMLPRLIGEDVAVVQHLAPDLGLVKADPSQIEQIVMNLAVNARDAMPKGGTLTIEASNVDLDARYAAEHVGLKAGPHVMLAVSDTGTGMDKATQAQIFEPFFTTKKKGKGTGLGLSTVYGIVQQSGGSIWVYSEPGQGATFKVYLPRTDETRVSDSGPMTPVTVSEKQTATILVVEDEEQVRTVVCTILRSRGYTVIEALTPASAIEICTPRTPRIDMLLTDVVMPRMGGRELALRIEALRPRIRVLYMSGYTDDAIVHHGVLDEGVMFLQKPITPDELSRKVREVLAMPR